MLIVRREDLNTNCPFYLFLFFIVVSWLIISWLLIIILIHIYSEVIFIKTTSFQHYCKFSSNMYQHNDNLGSDFPSQLPSKYTRLPVLVIGQTETLMWGIAAPGGPSVR